MRSTRTAALLVALVLPPLGFGCGSDSFKPKPPADPSELYWNLELNHHAVLLATAASYDTLTLVATPRNFRGEALTGLPKPQYVSSDNEKVMVTPDGVLHAIAPTPPGTYVAVSATLTAGNLRYRDETMVSVVSGDARPVVAGLSIHPLPPDSAKLAASNITAGISVNDTLPVRATNADGGSIPTMPGDPVGVLPVDIRAADPSMIDNHPADFTRSNILVGYRPGTTKIYASTTGLGVAWADTLEYRIGWPLLGQVDISPAAGSLPPGAPTGAMSGPNVFSMPDIAIGVGGVVRWQNLFDTTSQIDIRFSDVNVSNVASFLPAPSFIASSNFSWLVNFCGFTWILVDCGGGNMLFSPGGYRIALRVFPVPGTYEYTSTAWPGSRGRIVVVDER